MKKKLYIAGGVLLLLILIAICCWPYEQRALFRMLHADEPPCVEVPIDDEQSEAWYMPGYMAYATYREPDQIRWDEPNYTTLWLLNRYCSTYYHDGTEGEQGEMPIRPMSMGEEERQWIRRLSLLMVSELAKASSAQPKCCDDLTHVPGLSLGVTLLGNKKIWDDAMLRSPDLQNQALVQSFIELARRVSSAEPAEQHEDHDPTAMREQMLEPVLYRALQYAVTAPRSGNSEFFQGLDGMLCGFAARCFLWNEHLGESIYSERVADLLFRYMKGSSDSRLLQSFWAMENGPIDDWAQYRPFRERLYMRVYGLPIRLPKQSQQETQPDLEALVREWQQVLRRVDAEDEAAPAQTPA